MLVGLGRCQGAEDILSALARAQLSDCSNTNFFVPRQDFKSTVRQGDRTSFEDFHVLDQTAALVAVFDGHLGDEAAAFCAERLPLHLAKAPGVCMCVCVCVCACACGLAAQWLRLELGVLTPTNFLLASTKASYASIEFCFDLAAISGLDCLFQSLGGGY